MKESPFATIHSYDDDDEPRTNSWFKPCCLVALVTAIIVAIMCSCNDHEDDVAADTVPMEVRDAFFKMFPHAAWTQWEWKDPFYVADFTKGSFETEAWYSSTGEWAMTKTDYDNVSELPYVMANAFNTSQYSHWLIDGVEYFERPSGTFGVVDAQADAHSHEMKIFISSDGRIIKAAEDNHVEILPGTDIATY